MLIGIRRLFLAHSLVTAIVPMLLIGFIAFFVLRARVIGQIDADNIVLARSVSTQIETYLQEPASTFEFLAKHLSAHSHSPALISGLLDNLTDSYSYYDSVFLLDSRGIVKEAGFGAQRSTNRADFVGMDFSSLDICRQAMADNRISWQSTLSLSSGEPSLSFCAPLGGGTILATLNLSDLGRIINPVATKRDYDAFVVDTKGRIIVHPDPGMVLRQENVGNIGIITAALAGQNASGDFDLRGVRYRGSAVRIQGFGWAMVVVKKLDVAMSPVEMIQWLFLAGMAATIVVAVLASSLAGNMVSRPFAQLSENALHVINEEYDRIRPMASHSREIMLLSETLEKMIVAVRTRESMLNEQTEELMSTEETLRDLNLHLEERVKERTAMLEAAREELSLLNRDLLSRTMALEDANKHLESFSYSISHDLRAPLRHVGSFAAILEEECGGKLDEQGKEYLARIVNGCRRMDGLIEAILVFSRISRQSLDKVLVETESIVREVIAELRQDYPGDNVELVVGELPVCMADRTLFRQVWVNLLGNAFKYSSKREDPRIEVTASAQENEILFSIRDNGAGFDMRYADRLFGVFCRFHRQEEFEGTGVGLAIVHNIVQRHGGRIWAESAPGMGATFFFTIPSATVIRT